MDNKSNLILSRMPFSEFDEKKGSSTNQSLKFYGGIVVVVIAAFGLYFCNLKFLFLSDDFLFLNQFHFQHSSILDSFKYFGRDWGMGLNFYRPLTRVVWAVEYAVLGEHPGKWHLVELVLYAVNTALVYILAYKLTKRPGLALLAGLFFCFTPTHVEPVTWIADETDLWSALFCLSATIFYVMFRQNNLHQRLCYWVSVICFVLALLNKESGVSFFLIPLVYDLLLGEFRGQYLKQQFESGQLLRKLVIYVPFWILLVLYTVLRLVLFGGIGGYNYNPDQWTFSLDQFISLYSRWLIEPLPTQHTLPRLIIIGIAFVLIVGLVISEAVRRRQLQSTALPNATGVTFRLTRTTGFGLTWAVLFLLPAISTPPGVRFSYLATIGVAIVGAVLLTPFTRVEELSNFNVDAKILDKLDLVYRSSFVNIAKVIGVLSILFLAYFEIVTIQKDWFDASNKVTANILNGLRTQAPELPNYSAIYIAGLPGWSGESPPPLQVGFNEAVQLMYQNNTIHAFFVKDFPLAEQHLNQGYFAEYRNEQLILRNDVLDTLQMRNAKIKAKKEQVVSAWDFSEIRTIDEIENTWKWLSGNGKPLFKLKEGNLEISAPEGGIFSTPRFEVKATAFSSFELKLQSTSAANSETGLTVHWIVKTASGEVERTSSPLVIKNDGQPHIYKLKIPDVTAFYFDDIIDQFHLEIPSGLAELKIQQAQVDSYP